MHFWDPSQWDKMCFEYQRLKFQWHQLPPHIDSVLPSTNHWCPILTQYTASSPRNAQLSRLDLVLASLLTVVTVVKIQNDDLDHQQQTSAGVTNPFDSMTTIILKEELCKLVNAESRKIIFILMLRKIFQSLLILTLYVRLAHKVAGWCDNHLGNLFPNSPLLILSDNQPHAGKIVIQTSRNYSMVC